MLSFKHEHSSQQCSTYLCLIVTLFSAFFCIAVLNTVFCVFCIAVLSQEQLTSREMLELLSQGKAIQESSISEGGAAVEHVDTVEPDKQIEMLDASASSGVDSSKGTATDPMNTEHIDKSGTDPLDVGQSSSDNAVIVTKKTAPNAFYKCKSCTDKFLTHRHLITHRIRHHPEDLASYRCDQCSKSFFTNYDLNEHKAYKHPSGKDHVCDVCGKR